LAWFDRHQDEFPPDKSPVLDLGCGNGVTCVHLSSTGYEDVTGVDYSAAAIDLAAKVASSRQAKVKFAVADVLVPEECSALRRSFAACIDKGTYDAISLCPEDAAAKRKKYVNVAAELLKPDGVLAITSCNWTEKELRSHFESAFNVREVLPTPQFKFGGVVGNMVTSVIMQKKS